MVLSVNTISIKNQLLYVKCIYRYTVISNGAWFILTQRKSTYVLIDCGQEVHKVIGKYKCVF